MKKVTLSCSWISLLAFGLATLPLKADTIQVTSHISTAVTWHHTNEYVLNGMIYVLDGGVLNIEAGTVVKAKPGQDLNTSALLVTRGGKIFAYGTAANPIIFTAEADDVTDPEALPVFQRGLWGGIVLMGRAGLNTSTDVNGDAASPKYEVFEGLPDSQINGQFVNRFGGNDDNDSSGVMRFVSIRHAGVVFQPNKELNGLSLGAVGRGTTLEYIESFATADDGYEFFGGTVNTKHLISAFNDDDCFDIDQGYRGKNQFWFAIQEPGKKDNGGEWNGEPNGVSVGASPVGNYEIYNATWIGAGTGTTGNRGLQVREYAAPKLYNSILTQFGGTGLRIDTKSETHLIDGLLDIRDNIWWDFADVLAETDSADSSAMTANLFSDPTYHNMQVDPQLRGISRTNDFGLDPRPAPGSPALSSPRTPPSNGFYTPVSYLGAFDTNDLWIAGWTFLSQAGFLPARGANTVQVTANISDNVTWFRTNEYVLNGMIYVLDGGVLNIEAGTVVKAKPGQDLNTSALLVTRGGKIFAYGTAANPIIFTAEADDVTDPEALPVFQRGLWGGIVLMGRAGLNTSTDVNGDAASPKYEVFEGLPDSQINGQFVNRFGGNDDNDSSGVMRFVSIRHAGVVFQPNKELNGLSLGAVGRGTTLEYIESFATADDGYEFFGGTVNTKHLISAFNDDDCFDIDQGYRGKNQFWFAIQEPGKKDNGGEWNGEPNGVSVGASPVGNYEIYNATWIGAGTGTTGNRGLQVREYAAPKLYNSILTQFGGTGLRIDTKSETHLIDGLLDIRDNIWWDFADVLAETDSADSSAMTANLISDPTYHNMQVDPQLRGISRTNDFGLDPRPAPGSPALSSPRTPPSNGFYTPVSYMGAFDQVDWMADWTALSSLGFLNTEGGGLPLPPGGGTVAPGSPTLAIAWSADQLVLSFTSESGVQYQVQSATGLTGSPSDWADEGSPITGAGGTETYNAPVDSNAKFFRVLAQ